MPIARKLSAFLRIIRPELPLAAGMCVVIGEQIALDTLPPLKSVFLGFALGFFLSSSAMVFNDYFDIEVDRINSPQRPLPAGLLTLAEARNLGIFALLVSLVVAAFFHPLAVLLTLVVWLIGFLYNWKLKSAGLWGNLIVAANVALTIVMGGIAVGQAWNLAVWVFGLIAFCFDLAEEISADAMDAEGDRQRGSQSIAITLGKRTALNISTGLYMLMILLTFLPIFLGERSLIYILPITLMDLLIAFFALRLLRAQTIPQGRQSIRALYLTASLGLLAFLVGKLFA